jgi:tetratricopeptide (TPR) repeat protein
MSLDAANLQRCLKDGIRAVRRRNYVRGRELLLRVVEANPNQKDAWWWLYQATDDVTEQKRALENVLRLDPQHTEAQADLIVLRHELIRRQPAQAIDWDQVLAAAAIEPGDALDNVFQCPACGRPTRHDARRCRDCGQGLYWRVARGVSPEALHSLLLLLAVCLVVGLVELVGPLMVLGLSRQHVAAANFDWLESWSYVQLVVGDMTRLQPGMATLLIQVLGGRALVLAALLLGLREKWALAYWLGFLVALADLGLGLGLLVLGLVGVLVPAAHTGLALAVLLALVAVIDGFAVSHQRILVRPDGGARGALDFYQRGRAYSRRGLWAMAVAQWRRAVGLAPRTPHFYRDLAVGLAHIGFFERSQRAIDQAIHLAPDDPTLAEVAQLVRQRAQTDTLLRP